MNSLEGEMENLTKEVLDLKEKEVIGTLNGNGIKRKK